VRFVSNSLVACTRAITKPEPELADFSPLVRKSVVLLFAGRDSLLFSRVLRASKTQKRPCLIGLGSDRQGQC